MSTAENPFSELIEVLKHNGYTNTPLEDISGPQFFNLLQKAGSASPVAAGTKETRANFGPPAAVPPFELDDLTITELQDGLRSGQFTARSLAEKYLARIEAIDRRGPALRSVIEVNPDAVALA